MDLIGATPVPAEIQHRYIAEGLWNDVTVRDGLEAHAAKTPNRIAVADANGSWSYRRLATAVESALGCARYHGVGPGSVVLLIAPLVAAAVVAYQAVIRSGGVVLVVDRRSGRSDVEHALAAAGVDLAVSPVELAEQFGLDKPGVRLVTFDELLEWPEPCLDWEEPDPSQPRAAVFTSGTTSRPKCVVHSLNTLRSGARNMADALEITDQDVAFLSTPLASITGLIQTHLMLDRGGELVLEDRFDPAASLGRLKSRGATVLGGAPVIIEELFKQAAAENVVDLPLRALALGGAMIPRATLELAVGRYGIKPTRMYGSSEVPSATGTAPTDRGDQRLSDDGCCARGTEVRVVGGPPGEIQVRGPMRFLGYLEEQDNREAFVEGGWFRSGDLGTFEQSRLTVVGRLKETVSRKGLKISLTEMDDKVRRLPGVGDVASFGLPDPDTGERLAIAVHADDLEAVTYESVVSWLLEGGLAKWKLPEQIVLWDQPLPRTESGKIQRRLLVAGVEARRSLYAPRLR